MGAALFFALAACSSDSDSSRLASSFGGSFCDAVRAYASLAKSGGVGYNVDSSMSDEEIDRRVSEAEDRLRAQIEEGRVILSDVKERAPAEIAADVTLVVDTDLEYLDALERNDYDLFSLLADPRFGPRSTAAQAARRVNDYTKDKCGTELKAHLEEIGTVTSTVGTPGPVGGSRTPGTAPSPPRPPPPPPSPPGAPASGG